MKDKRSRRTRTGSEIWESRGRAELKSEELLRTLNLVCQRKGRSGWAVVTRSLSDLANRLRHARAKTSERGRAAMPERAESKITALEMREESAKRTRSTTESLILAQDERWRRA